MTKSDNRETTRRKHQVGLPARRAAIEILRRVLTEKRPLDATLAQSAESGLMTGLSQKDRALARALVATSLRRKGQIDDLIAKFTDTPINRKKTGIAYEALLIGAAQILFLRVPSHAAIDLSVRAVAGDTRGGRKLSGFVNAVLHTIAREGEAVVKDQDVARLNTPGWLYESWTKAYGGPGAKAIAEAHMDEPPVDLTVKADRDGWAGRLSATPVGPASIRLAPSGRIENLEGYDDGDWWVQDVAATLPVALLGQVEGKTVYDLCSAPGGKTLQLATAGANVVSVDASEARLERLRKNLERTGLSGTVLHADVLELDETEKADAILLDAPCSATGTIRRHPDILHLKTKSSIKALGKIQAQLLQKAVRLLKPGGILIYCTCSLQPDEGEKQIEKLLSSNGGIERSGIAPDELGTLSEAVTEAGDLRTKPSINPGTNGGMDGFYAARLRKLDTP